MRKIKVFAAILTAGVLLFAVGCKRDVETPIAVESVKITAEATEVTEESTITLTATVSPENATDPAVTWTSSDKTVATVDSSGVVTGVSAGTATITATAGEKSDSVQITVNAAKISLKGLTLTSSSAKVYVGEEITLIPTFDPENATDKNVTYTLVEGENFASIEENKLTGKADGTVKIKATADGVSSEEIQVTVKTWSNNLIEIAGATITGETYSNNSPGVFLPSERSVTLGDFYMTEYEITQKEYKTIMQNQKVTVDDTTYTLEAEPSSCNAESTYYALDLEALDEVQNMRPVERVTWYDAVYYCNARSKAEDLTPAYNITVTKVNSENHITNATVTLVENANGYRLPTDAEWEYAARGGSQSADDWNYTFSGADTESGVSYAAKKNTGLDTVGWYCYNNITGETGTTDVTDDSSGRGTHEVGKKAKNRLGLYDMSGNVREWCYDWYISSYSITTETPATGPDSGNGRVVRGGSWSLDADDSSVSYRNYYDPYDYYVHIGFRVVRSKVTE